MLFVTIIDPEDVAHTIAAEEGQSLMVIAKSAGLPIRGNCGGQMACATCHVIVSTSWFAALPPASGGEEKLLDIVPHAKETSRLACQIKMSAELDGLTVRIPQRRPRLRGSGEDIE
jgi:ferredoxin-2, mitochondrial